MRYPILHDLMRLSRDSALFLPSGLSIKICSWLCAMNLSILAESHSCVTFLGDPSFHRIHIFVLLKVHRRLVEKKMRFRSHTVVYI